MLDFPIGGLLDENACLAWLEQYPHPHGLKCPRCGGGERRLAKQGGHFPAYRCKDCDRYHTILSGTALHKTRQKPSTIVLILRGICQGETTSRLSRELWISRKQMSTIRHRLQHNVQKSLSDAAMAQSGEFEADELYQNAGEKGKEHSDPPDAPRRRGNKRKGLGTWEQERYYVREHADAGTCQEVVRACLPPGAPRYTDGLTIRRCSDPTFRPVARRRRPVALQEVVDGVGATRHQNLAVRQDRGLVVLAGVSPRSLVAAVPGPLPRGVGAVRSDRLRGGGGRTKKSRSVVPA